MKALIIGSSSYIGARILFDLSKTFEATGTYFSNNLSEKLLQLDITDKGAVKALVTKVKPDVIVHVANNASSGWCNKNPDKAILLNQTATEYIVDVANEIEAKLIYISSLAAVEPQDIYGNTKQASEEITKRTVSGWLILRPSLTLGYSPNTINDRPFNRLLKNLDEDTPAIYENAWHFQPTYLNHISEVIKACIEKSIWNKTLPVVCPEMTTRYETAKDILSPFNIEVSIDETAKSLPKDFEIDLEEFNALGLPSVTYNEMIKGIVKEIKHRDKFKL